MKRIYLLVAVLTVAIWACSENTPITEPTEQTNLNVAPSVTAEPNWVTMPKLISKSLNKGTGFSVTENVKADKNTKLEINDSYEGPDGKVKVHIVIDFKKGTVAEDTEITMIFDIETGVITFSPLMIFNKDAQLEVSMGGFPEGSLTEDINFLYLEPNGNYEAVDNHFIKVKIDKGEVTLKHGLIPHFSRYGFVK